MRLCRRRPAKCTVRVSGGDAVPFAQPRELTGAGWHMWRDPAWASDRNRWRRRRWSALAENGEPDDNDLVDDHREGERLTEAQIYASVTARQTGPAFIKLRVLAVAATGILISAAFLSGLLRVVLIAILALVSIVIYATVNGAALAWARDERRNNRRAVVPVRPPVPRLLSGGDDRVHASDIKPGDWISSFLLHQDAKQEHERERRERQERQVRERELRERQARQLRELRERQLRERRLRERRERDRRERQRREWQRREWQRGRARRRLSSPSGFGIDPDLDLYPYLDLDLPLEPLRLDDPIINVTDIVLDSYSVPHIGLDPGLESSLSDSEPAKHFEQVTTLLRRPENGIDLVFGLRSGVTTISTFDRSYYRRRTPGLPAAEESADGTLAVLMAYLCGGKGPSRESQIVVHLSRKAHSLTAIRHALDISLAMGMTWRYRERGWSIEVLRSTFTRSRVTGHEHCLVGPTDAGRLWVVAGRRRPRWTIPATCPVCGRPVEQAVQAFADRPLCESGHPLPTEPYRRADRDPLEDR